MILFHVVSNSTESESGIEIFADLIDLLDVHDGKSELRLLSPGKLTNGLEYEVLSLADMPREYVEAGNWCLASGEENEDVWWSIDALSKLAGKKFEPATL